jgi:dihydroflavonol-4-reductase
VKGFCPSFAWVDGAALKKVDTVKLDVEALAAAMQGCDAVYHAAGANAFCVRDPTSMFEVNVDGSRNIILAAARADFPRVVYTSSAATLGEARGTIGSEKSSHRGWFLSDYERSKFEAEQVVMETARESGVEVVCVNPASVQGPGRSSGSARLLLDYLNGRLRAFVDSRLSLVDIADCTQGHVLAGRHGKPGERYVLSGSTLGVRKGLELVARIAGVHRPLRTVPPYVAMAVGTAGEVLARVRRDTPRICRELVRTLLHGHAYDGSKATRELGLTYTPVEETLRRTIDWWIAQDLVAGARPE